MALLQRLLLLFQGLYYALTGLWAIVALENFSRVTRHFGDAYEMHSIAALAVAIGVFFILGALKESWRRPAMFLLVASAIAVILPELWYFSEIRGTLFVLDLVEEIAVAVVALAAIITLKK